LGHEQGGFAARLQAALERSGTTQAALARAADVDQSSISRYLRGQCEPNLRQFRSIALALGLKPAALLPEEDEVAESIVAIPSSDEECYYIFRGNTFLGEWHGITLDVFRKASVIQGKDARKLLDSAGIEESARAPRPPRARSATRRPKKN
jgi:transcriptional regulator with XRE-family HTH domain